MKFTKRRNVFKRLANRDGVTAVEFAMVVPIVFLLVFVIFDLARLMLLSGNVNTALLTGVRHATLADSTSAEVDELIRSELRVLGVAGDDAQINITPPVFGPGVTEVQIDVEVPAGTSFGLQLSQVSKSITVDRE